jgi:hypothetical protein
LLELSALKSDAWTLAPATGFPSRVKNSTVSVAWLSRVKSRAAVWRSSGEGLRAAFSSAARFAEFLQALLDGFTRVEVAFFQKTEEFDGVVGLAGVDGDGGEDEEGEGERNNGRTERTAK